MTVSEILHDLSAMKITASEWTRPTIDAAMKELRTLKFENEELRARIEEMKKSTHE